jgi:tetratricopeptide (TPR) repeat protein
LDFLDFEGENLYFDDPSSDRVVELIEQASAEGRSPEAELPLLQAYFLEPNQLTVLVALYRYYYYTHRLDDALVVVNRAMDAAASRLGLSSDWRRVTIEGLGYGILISMGLTRFYLHALKASAVVCMRMRNLDEAIDRLNKLAELDPMDQFGAKPLLEIADRARREAEYADVPGLAVLY